MKEIIKPGKMAVKIKYSNTCPYCQCEYTYEEEDVFSDYSSTATAYVTCPECGGQNLAAILPPLNHISRIYSPFYDYSETQVHKLWSNLDRRIDEDEQN